VLLSAVCDVVAVLVVDWVLVFVVFCVGGEVVVFVVLDDELRPAALAKNALDWSQSGS